VAAFKQAASLLLHVLLYVIASLLTWEELEEEAKKWVVLLCFVCIAQSACHRLPKRAKLSL
jgi:hypothetical protein